MSEKVSYRGKTYWVQTNGRYFQSGHHDDPERLLHRAVWLDNHGPIPKGYHVHHKNGDWRDNRIENLELVSGTRHMSSHMRERMDAPVYRKRALEGLTKAQVAAAKWHGSKAGLAWHSEHGKKTWKTRTTSKIDCTVCHKPFETYFAARVSTRFCSHACEQRVGYQRHKTAKANCARCGKEFRFNKYRTQACCSRLCGNRHRAEQNA